MLDRIWSELRFRVRALLHRDDMDRELDEEVSLHIELETSKLVANGLDRTSAMRRARMSFGGEDRIREATRDARGNSWIEIARQDGGYAFRQLVADWRFAAMVIVTLTLGIGVSGAVFPIVDRLLFQLPAGVAAPDELMRLYRQVPPSKTGPGWIADAIQYPAIQNIASVLPAGAELTAYGMYPGAIGHGENAPKAEIVQFAPRYFDVLRVRPVLGRLPTVQEQRMRDAPHVALISHHEWKQRFGGDASVLGKSIEVRYRPYTIIGVLPPDFRGVDVSAGDYWIPYGSTNRPGGLAMDTAWNVSGPSVIVRAPVEMHARIPSIASVVVTRGAPEWIEKTTRVIGGSIISAYGPQEQPAEIGIATRLAAVSLILLLITIANVANLSLARAARRRREIAVRLALGISRMRLMVLLGLETILLSVAAAAAALVVSGWCSGVLRTALFPDMTWPGPPIQFRAALFTFAVALAAGVCSGLPSVLRAGRLGLVTALKSGSRQGGDRRSRLRDSLVALQAGLSVILLVAAAVFVRSLHEANTIDTGFDVDRLAVITVRYDGLVPRDDDVRRIMPELMQRLAAVPGVEAMAGAEGRPFVENAWSSSLFDELRTELHFQLHPPTFQVVAPNFFDVSGLRIEGGRSFTDAERDPAAPVIVVNREMAGSMWPGESPLGKCLRSAPDRPCMRVVGVVENAHSDNLIEPQPKPHYYMSLSQAKNSVPRVLIVRAHENMLQRVMENTRVAMRAGLPHDMYPDVQPITERFERELHPWRLGAALFTAMGILALVVALIGTYSTVSYTVNQSTHEMGVRIAMGAQASQVVRMVVGKSVEVVTAGVLLGVLAVLMLERMIDSLLYNTTPRDPAILGGVMLLLVAAAAAASFGPAWRASNVDPATALRAD